MKTTLESGLKVIDSAYDAQAQTFLDRFGIKFRATLSDSKVAPWVDGERTMDRHHYRICLSKSIAGKQPIAANGQRICSRIVFDFFGSHQACLDNEHPSAYDVLACISGDTYCADTFEDWCGELGYETDSIKALQTYRRCKAFAGRLNQFFTSEEIEALREIN